MRSWLRHHVRTIIVVLTITLLLSTLPSATFAQGRPTVTVTGSGTDTCDGRPVASVVQGDAFNVGVAGFPGAAPLNITFTFPDGRILSPGSAAALAAPPTVLNYVGAPLLPTTIPLPIPPFTNINASYIYPSLPSWPTGCYTVTITEPGPKPVRSAKTQFRLLPQPVSAQSGNLKLWVQAAGTNQAAGEQPVAVNIFGQGVAGPLVINIVQPNGAIIGPFGSAVAPDGSFTLPYAFGFLHQIGVYTIYATVIIPVAGSSPLVYTAKTQFNLTAAPVPAIAATNNATLTMLDRFNTLVPQGTPLKFMARGFTPAALAVSLILPNGVQLVFPLVPVLPDGNAPIPPGGKITFGNGFPTGAYQMIATQTNPPFPVARTATTTWRMIPQQP
ncbi:MAG: hypothetical protein WCK70_17755 [Chloroflexales bacterium]